MSEVTSIQLVIGTTSQSRNNLKDYCCCSAGVYEGLMGFSSGPWVAEDGVTMKMEVLRGDREQDATPSSDKVKLNTAKVISILDLCYEHFLSLKIVSCSHSLWMQLLTDLSLVQKVWLLLLSIFHLTHLPYVAKI